MTLHDELDLADKRVIKDIEKHGWSDMGVFGTQDEPCAPFNYTVGFSLDEKTPEVIVIGLHNEQAHGVLWAIYRQMVKHDIVPEAGKYYYDVVQNGLTVAFVKAPLDHDIYMMSMVSRLMGPSTPALQMVWPDVNGRFPWHDDFTEKYRAQQPLLGEWEGPRD